MTATMTELEAITAAMQPDPSRPVGRPTRRGDPR